MLRTGDFAGVTAPQRELIAYWTARRDASGLVARDAVDPGALRAMLDSLSIVEVDEQGDGRFRICGSRLRDIFGREARGMRVADVAGVLGETYALGLSAAIDRGAPVGGLMEASGRSHAWLRLPLAGPDRRLTQVLCHDELLTSQRRLLNVPATPSIPPSSPRFAA